MAWPDGKGAAGQGHVTGAERHRGFSMSGVGTGTRTWSASAWRQPVRSRTGGAVRPCRGGGDDGGVVPSLLGAGAEAPDTARSADRIVWLLTGRVMRLGRWVGLPLWGALNGTRGRVFVFHRPLVSSGFNFRECAHSDRAQLQKTCLLQTAAKRSSSTRRQATEISLTTRFRSSTPKD